MMTARSASSPRTGPDLPRIPGAVLLSWLVTGCASGIPAADPLGFDSTELPLMTAAKPLRPAEADVLGLDEEMRQFLAMHVDPRASANRRLSQLVGALMVSGRFNSNYEERTYTAAEAFHRRAGNCLSFTNMFVALARAAGLNVRFQEVDIPPDWTRSGQSLVLNRHIDALIVTGDGRERVVDFNNDDFRTTYDHRPVTDERGFAHFHSNRGVEQMQAGNMAAALAHFRRAVESDPGHAPAWVNLGTLYLRSGQAQQAASAWQQALRVEPGESVALSNLERLYRHEGRVELADVLRDRIRRHRLQNPYYRYFLARQAFHAGDYDGAIGHLRFAIARKKNEDRFYALLGLSYLGRGDDRTAHHWMARAGEVAGDEELQRRYHSKLELLRRTGGRFPNS
jgi:Flp pilus assembly protein TadD